MIDPIGLRLIHSALLENKIYLLNDTIYQWSEVFRNVIDFCLNYKIEYSEYPKTYTVEEKFGLSFSNKIEPFEFISDLYLERQAFQNAENLIKEQVSDFENRDLKSLVQKAEIFVKNYNKKQTKQCISYKDNAELRFEEYLRLKRGEIEDGIDTPWPSLNKQIKKWVNGTINIILGNSEVGKCVHKDTEVVNPDTGEINTIKYAVDNKWPINSLNLNTGKLENKIPSAWINTGVKECLKLKFKSGQELICTPEHPLLSVRGWKRADEFNLKEQCGRVSFIPEPFKFITVNESHLIIIACLLADGCLTRKEEITYTKSNLLIINKLKDALKEVGSDLYKRPKQKEYEWTIKNANLIWSILEKYNIPLGLSKDKIIPNIIFKLSNKQLALFLGLFISSDGTFYKSIHGATKIEVGLASKKFVDQIHNLLLRFNVFSTLRDKNISNKYYARILSVDHNSINNYIDNIPIFRDDIYSKNNQQNNSYQPIFYKDLIVKMSSFYKQKGYLLQNMSSSILANWKTYFAPQSTFKLDRLRKYEIDSGESLGYLTSKQLVWDEIISIENIGEQEVYDLSIADNHCFIAANLVVHNTWALGIMANHASINKHKSLFVSREMSKFRLEKRLDVLKFKIPFKDLRDAELDFISEERYKNELITYRNSDEEDIIIAGKQEIRTVDDIIRFVSIYEPKIVLIDGGYLLKSKQANKSNWENQENIVKELQEAAEVTNIPWIISSQLWDDDSKVTSKFARRDKVKYGKEWIIGADVCLSLRQNEDMKHMNVMELEPLKLRDAYKEAEKIIINWNTNTMDYTEVVNVQQPVSNLGDIVPDNEIKF